jgi:hypothetical protein
VRVHLDRRRFLELVTAIAAGSCGGSTPEQHVVTVPLDVRPLPEASAAPLAVGPAPSRSDADRVTLPPVDPSAVGGSGIWDFPYDPAAPPRTCAQLRCGGPTAEGMKALRSSCRSLEAMLRPEVFQRFLSCMLARNNTPDTCDLARVGTEPDDCLHKWTSPPSIDPSTAATCKPIVAACAGSRRSQHASKALEMQTCQAIFSVTTPRAERKMIHCVTEYCEDAKELCYMATMY